MILLSCIHAQTAGSAVEIVEPLDGDRGLLHSFYFHYRAHQPGQVSCFIDGRNVHTSAELEQRLQIPYLPLGFHTLELQLTTVDEGGEGGEGEVLGYDVVEVFVLGNGQLAPEGLDDDARVQKKSDSMGLQAAIDAALLSATYGTTESIAAEVELERIVTALANAPGALVPHCYYALAQVLLARGDIRGLERAIAALREAVWHSPAHGNSHHLLAVLLAHQRRATRSSYARGETPASVVRGNEAQQIQAHAQTAHRLLKHRAETISATLSQSHGKHTRITTYSFKCVVIMCVYVCTRTHEHTRIHAYAHDHVQINTHAHVHIHLNMLVKTLVRTYTCTQVNINSRTHTCTHPCVYAYI